jgi:hypothetical protein
LVAAAEVVAGPRIPVAVNTGDRDVSLRILKIKQTMIHMFNSP